MRFIPSNLASLAEATHTSDTKYALTCVQLQELEGGYRVDATDTRILAKVVGREHPEAKDHVGCIAALANQPNGGTKALVQAKQWKELLKASAQRRKAARKSSLYGTTGIVISEQPDIHVSSTVTAASSDGTGQARVETFQSGTGRFPPIDDILPRGKPAATITLGIDYLQRLLDVAKSVAGENNCVTLDIYPRSNRWGGDVVQPVLLRAQPDDKSQLFTGLIMPACNTDPVFVDPLANGNK